MGFHSPVNGRDVRLSLIGSVLRVSANSGMAAIYDCLARRICGKKMPILTRPKCRQTASGFYIRGGDETARSDTTLQPSSCVDAFAPSKDRLWCAVETLKSIKPSWRRNVSSTTNSSWWRIMVGVGVIISHIYTGSRCVIMIQYMFLRGGKRLPTVATVWFRRSTPFATGVLSS